MDVTDKENVCEPALNDLNQVSEVSTPTASTKCAKTDTPSLKHAKKIPRTPLQDVNNKNRISKPVLDSALGLQKAVKVLQYGQLTPLSAPAKSYQKKRNLQKMDVLNFESGSAHTPTRRTPYAQYRKMIGVFTHYKQDFEERLSCKDDYIKTLEQKLGCNTGTSFQANKFTSDMPAQIKYNDLIFPEGEANETSTLKSSSVTDNCEFSGVATSPHRTPIPLKTWQGIDNPGDLTQKKRKCLFVPFVSPSVEPNYTDGTRSVGCSPIKISVDTSHSVADTTQCKTIPKNDINNVSQSYINTNNDNGDVPESVTNTSNIAGFAENSTIYTSVQLTDNATTFEKADVMKCATNTSVLMPNNKSTCDIICTTDATAINCVTGSGINTSDISLELVERAINTSIIEVNNAETETVEITVEDIATNTSSITFEHTGTVTEQENKLGVDSTTNNVAIMVESEGTNTEKTTFSDCSMNTSFIGSEDVSAGIENVLSVDVDTNTNLSGPVILKQIMSNVGTEVTPKKTVDVGVLTSASNLYVARPSDIGVEPFDEDDLTFQLESASISNTLLRNELEQAHVKEKQVLEELENTRKMAYNTENKVMQAELKARGSVEEQIQSLMTVQAEYLTQISELESNIKQQNKSIKEKEDKFNNQVSWLKDQNSKLQSDLKLVYNQKKFEIQALETKYAQEDYKNLYHRSQVQLKQSQSQLGEFAQLITVMNDSQQTQIEAQKILEEGVVKIKQVAQKNIEERELFEQKVSAWQEEKVIIEKDAKSKIELYQETKTKHDELCQQLENEKTQISQLEKALDSANEQVSVAQQSVEDFSALNKSLIQGLDDKDAEIKKLTFSNEELQKEIKDNTVKMMTMTDMFDELSGDLHNFKTEIMALQREKVELNDEHEKLKESYASEMTLLKKSLSAKEEENEQLSKSNQSLQQVSGEQKCLIESLEKDLDEMRTKQKYVNTLEEHLEKIQITSKENQEFMEREQYIMKGELLNLKEKYKEIEANLESTISEKEALLNQLQLSNEKCQETEAELDHVKTEAHMMLLQQGNEITSGINSVTKLSDKLHAMFQQLQLRSEKVLQHQCDDHKEAAVSNNLVNDSDHVSPSNLTDGEKVATFLTSVITAIQGNNKDQPEVTSDNIEYRDETSSTVNTVGSSCSAFSKFQDNQPSDAPIEMSECIKTDQYSSEVDISSASEVLESTIEQIENNCEINIEEAPLSVRVDNLNKLVGEIISVVILLDKAFTKNEECLNQTISQLNKQIEFEKLDKTRFFKDQDDKVAVLELQLCDAVQREKSLRSELQVAKQQYTQSEQNLIAVRKMCEEKNVALQIAVEEKTDYQKLKEEFVKLQRALTQKTTECKIVQESLDDVLLKLEDKSERKLLGAGGEDMKYARESYLLKSEVNKLKQKLLFTKEEMDELVNKANSRQKKLEYNCKKADEELYILDNTIDKMRYLLRKHQDVVRTWPDAKAVWMEIVYDKRTDDDSMKWT